MTDAPPNELMQLASLYHAASGEAETVFSICDVADFQPGHQQDLASVIIALMRDGDVDQMSVFHRCSQSSKALLEFYVQRVPDMYGTPTYCANAACGTKGTGSG